MDKMAKLFEKKKKMGPGMPDIERDAKMGVLKNLRDQAAGAMGDKLKGLKKVTVASDSPAGLEKGLEKAKEIVDSGDEADEDEMATDVGDSLPVDMQNLSEEEINKKLELLMKLKEKLQSEKGDSGSLTGV